jgi:zinc transport system substrate-binding protein
MIQPAQAKPFPMSKNIFRNRPAILGVLGLLTAFPVSSRPFGPFPAPAQVRILATVFPVAEFAREIAGDRGKVSLLLPAGADVHTWQPRISDIRRLETADLLVFVGAGLEPWLDGLLRSAKAPHQTRLEVSLGLELLPAAEEEQGREDHVQGAFDPHIWLDFRSDEAIADRIAGALAAIDPAGGPDFVRRSEALKSRLRALDAKYAAALQNCRGREFVLGGHAAFAYLARRYGLRQSAVYGASPDAAPTPKDLAAVIGRAKRDGIGTIFFEPSVGDKMARLIAAEIGADVRVLQTGHILSPEQKTAGVVFFDLMAENLEALVHGLGCR